MGSNNWITTCLVLGSAQDTFGVLVLDMITKQDSTVDTNYALVSRVKDALTWGWAVTAPHALGEGNFAAEWLVNLGPGRNPLYRDGWRINDPSTVFYLTLYCHLVRS